jgi:hypothetical protein
VLFEGTYLGFDDVAPDGRFLMVKNAAVASEAQTNQLNVVVHWLEELKARVPTR